MEVAVQTWFLTHKSDKLGIGVPGLLATHIRRVMH